MAEFNSLRFHVTDPQARDQPPIPRLRGVTDDAGTTPGFNSDEAAARHYLDRLMARDPRSTVRGLRAPDRPELVPDMQFVDSRDVPTTNTKLVRFAQTHAKIPVFGSRAVVEVDADRNLVSIQGEVSTVEGVSSVASLSPAEAIDKVRGFTGAADVGEPETPELNFFLDEAGTWHLAYVVRGVRAAPPDRSPVPAGIHAGHGLGRSPRDVQPVYDYLIDAHDGAVVFWYSAAPTISVPSQCKGVDELGQMVVFWGRSVDAGFEMHDPLRDIHTFDLKGGDIANANLPADPVTNASADWMAANTAAVSAHVNAMRVYDFYNSVLMRDGIDDKGMDLVSVVNVTYAHDEPPPEWHNAVWWNGRMWYGQSRSGQRFSSYSRYLDIIAHELTHGITEKTSNLVYKNQSGALNESFSDIFGIIIKNWYAVGADSDVAAWDWELGPGLGDDGLPLRDLRDPTRTGDPDHMSGYQNVTWDDGGVHTNSNIHNKAAYNLLNAADASGRVFTAREVAYLYYLCLARLSPMATFRETLQTLQSVAATYWKGDPPMLARAQAAITSAYAAVGIT